MDKTIVLILRIILGLALLFFGTNKFFNFVEMPPPPSEEAINYFTALTNAKVLTMVAIVETLAGLSLLINKYTPLMMIILMGSTVNALLYHITLDPEGILMALIVFLLNVTMLFIYRDRYRDILKP